MSAMVAAVKELWEQAILPYNLPLSILLGLMIVFWLFTLIGAVSMDSLDMDLDADVDADLDAEGDLDGHSAGLGAISGAMLRIVNAGYVPVTVVLSVLILMMWIASLILNYYFNPGHAGWLAFGFFLVAFVLAVIATKLLTQPLVPFMKRLKEAENTPPVIGSVGTVRSITIDSRYGQVEVERSDGAPALLNARLSSESMSIPRGAQVVVVSLDETTGVYLVRPLSATPPVE